MTPSSQCANIAAVYAAVWWEIVRIISKRVIREFVARHADAGVALEQWYKAARTANWRSLAEVRQDYPYAGAVGNKTVFNIKGNTYRLIAAIHYNRGIVYIRAILTHAEYDRGAWKQQ